MVEAPGKRVLSGAVQVTTALTISTLAGSAIVSLSITRTSPTSTTTSCSITAHEELLQTLRAIEQRNAQLPHEMSKAFAEAVKPLLDVLRSAAQQALGPSLGVARGALYLYQ